MKKLLCIFLVVSLMISHSMQGYCALSPPELSCVSSGTELKVSWTPVYEATGYKLSYAPRTTSGIGAIGTIDVGSATRLSADLWVGAEFYLAAQSYDAQQAMSAYSDLQLCIVNSPAAPSAPQLSTTIEQQRVTLSWTPVAGATGYALLYTPLPFMGTGTFIRVDVGSRTDFVASLPQGAAFAVAVKAYNGAGDSEMSNIRSFLIAQQGMVWYQVGNDVLAVSLTPPSNLLSDPAAIVEAIQSPATANVGIWSLVSELGLGVYTPAGDVVMQGAETSVNDYWLYDRQIPLLAKAAFTRTTFVQFLQMLFSVYPDVDWYTAYVTTGSYYQANPDKFLAKVFGQMGTLDLLTNGDMSEPNLTRLEEYLLSLDITTSANAGPAIGVPRMANLSKSAGYISRAMGNQRQYNICIDKSIVQAVAKNYGMNYLLNLVGIGEINDVMEFGDALFTDLDIDRNVYVDRHSTHVKSCGEPSPKVTGQVYLTIGGNSNIAETVATCGRQAGMLMGYQGHNPFPGIPVNWEVSGAGTSRVYYDSLTTRTTDMGGSAKIEFEPRETNECKDTERSDSVVITPRFGTEAMMTFLGGAGWPQAAAAIVTKVINNTSSMRPQATFDIRYHYSTQSSAKYRTLPRTYEDGGSLGW